MPYFASALQLLIKVAFDALLLLFLLRLFAELCRADFRNPISQFVYRYSNPVLAPVRRWVPNWRRWNLAAVLVAWVVELLKWLLLFGTTHTMPRVGGLLLLGVGSLISFALIVGVVLVFAWALSTMFTPQGGRGGHPVMHFITQLVEPPMRPLSKRVPSIAGIDFSPTIAIVILLLGRILIAQPLIDAGLRSAFVG